MRLVWGVEPPSVGLVQGHPAVDSIVVFNRGGGLRAYADYIRRLRSEKAGLVLDLQRHFKSGLTSYLSGARRRIGFHPRSSREFNWLFNNEYIEKTDKLSLKILQYQKFADRLGAESMQPLEYGLTPTDTELQVVCSVMQDNFHGDLYPDRERRYVVFPGSTWESRFWIAGKYTELFLSLYRKHGLVPVIIGGKGERDYVDRVLEGIDELPRIDIVGKTSIRELVAVSSEVSFGVGADCGPMHIAAGCGLPVVTLWGATSALRSAPSGSEHLVLQSTVKCSPCYRKHCPLTEHYCMQELSVDAVEKMIGTALSSSDGLGVGNE
jgi:ADP-heptose:LPS heptosyltransferase